MMCRNALDKSTLRSQLRCVWQPCLLHLTPLIPFQSSIRLFESMRGMLQRSLGNRAARADGARAAQKPSATCCNSNPLLDDPTSSCMLHVWTMI